MDYHLKPVNKECAATGKPLAPGSVCHSVLVTRLGELVRLDFSGDGWSGPPEGTVGYWQCKIPKPVDNKTQPLDPDALMRYFEQLSEEANPATEKVRYVTALLLLQKKRLKLESSRPGADGDILELVGSRGEGQFDVQDWQLPEDEIQQLQSELNTQLNSEWN